MHPQSQAVLEATTIAKGLELMLYGMGLVFFFLTIMVIVMYLVAAFFKEYSHLFPEEEKSSSHIQKIARTDNADIAVVIAAVENHKKT